MGFTQPFFYFPLPIGDRAIPPAVPDSKHKPGARRCGNGDQVRLSCFYPYPAKKIESGQDKMSEREKYVEKFEQVAGIKGES